MLLVIEVRPAHYKWRLGNIGRSINDRCRPASAGPSKMGYFQDSWSHVQWKNLLKGLSSHHINMNLCYIFLLLLVILSAYSESPQYCKHSDSFDLPLAAVCPNSSSDNLGILAPVLPQNESGSVLSQSILTS